MSGLISGSGGLTKTGGGVLLLDGSLANTYTGTTTVQQGLLELGKPGIMAVPGPLVVGPGTGPADSTGAKCLQPGEINPVASVTIRSDGYLDLTAVNFSAAGSVTGSGRVELGIGTTFFTGADNTSETFSGLITGLSATLVKVGSGAWTVSGTNTLLGQVQVGSGTMFVDGSFANCSCVVSNTATLGGNGTVGTLTALGGSTIAPGHGPGILNSGSVTFSPASIFTFNLTGTNLGTGYSQLNVTVTVTENSPTLQVQMTEAGHIGAVYTIINNDLTDAVIGTFAGLAEGATLTANTGAKFTISYQGGTGNDVVLTQISNVNVPVFSGIQAVGGGGASLNGSGIAGEDYDVQLSTNLANTNWVTITTVLAGTNGIITFTDTNDVALPERFYRLKAD